MIRPLLHFRVDATPLAGVLLALWMVVMVGIPPTNNVDLEMLPPYCQCGDTYPMIDISPTGLTIEKHASSLATLDQDLHAISITPDTTLYILADLRLSYGAFMVVMKRLHNLGYKKIVLINEDW